jgi:hypothetical protein
MFDWEQPQWKIERTWPAKKDRLVIGWVGLTSHFEDIKKMVPIFKYIHDKYAHTDFVLSGMAIKDTEVNISVDKDGNKKFDEKDITDEKKTYRWRVKQMFLDAGFDANRITFNDATSLEEYGKFYADIDIGLGYLENLTFNQCKSEIKVVEYMKYGVVPIWMNIGGYQDMYKNIMDERLRGLCKDLALETENPQRWKEVLEKVVVEYDKYKKVAFELKSFVEDKYDINKQSHDRVDYYTHLIENHLEQETNRIQNILIS